MTNTTTTTPHTLLAIMDVGLVALNLVNVFVGIFPKILPPYITFKKNVLKLQYSIFKKAHSIPCLVLIINSVVLAITFYLTMKAKESDINDENNNNNNNNNVFLPRAIISGFTLLCMIMLQNLSETLIVLGYDRVMEQEVEMDRHGMANFKPISKTVFNTILAPMETFLRSEGHGMEHVPTDQPALYVMNHSLMGVEMGSFINLLYQNKNIFVRGLADHFHFSLPHGEFLRHICGAVNGTRANVDCLMEHKQNVLVYPGGANEVMKHSSVPKYELMWKERLGFARMAIKHGYPIMPCAAVGIEDMLDIMADLPIDFLRQGLTIPLVGPVSPHRIQKVYFWFGESIPTAQYKGDYHNDVFAKEVRDKTKAAVEMGIKQMKQRQENDPDRFLIHQVTNQIHSAKEEATKVLSSAFTISPIGGVSSSSLGDDEDDVKKEK